MKSSRRKQTNPNRVSSGVLEPDKMVELGSVQNKPDLNPGSNPDQESVAHGRESNSAHSDDSPPPPRTSTDGDYDLPLDMHVPVLSCPVCPETFPNIHDLHEHKLEAHGPEAKRLRKEADDTPDDFPTAYHRLGRELRGSTELSLPNGHEKPQANESSPLPIFSSSSSPSGQTPLHPRPLKFTPEGRGEDDRSPLARTSDMTSPMSKINKEGSNSNVGELPWGTKSERIFHMDAYCELCDREFCNKYFLKTHKANKHGIYEDNSPPAGGVPLPMHGMMGGQDQNTPFNNKLDASKPPPPSDEPILPWSFKLDSTSSSSPLSTSHMAKKLDVPSSNGNNILPPKHMESPLPMFPHPMPNMEKHFGPGKSGPRESPTSNASSMESTVSSTSILNTITNSIKAAPPMNDPSMEDYCHICQKHFCNKYYLKKHKQDVHGIAPESPSVSSVKRSRSSILDNLPNTSSNPMMLPQPLAGLTSMPNLHGMPGLPNMPNMPNMPPGVMVINPYSLPPVAIIPAGSLMPGQQIPPPPHPIISQPLSMVSIGEAPLAVSASAPSSISTNVSQSPPLKTSGLTQSDTGNNCSGNNAGLNNNSDNNTNNNSSNGGGGGVHCNICSKEFCNEFYLQVHKESKHRVRRPTDEEESPRERALSLIKDPKRSECGRASPPSLPSVANRHEGMHLPPMSPMGGREPGRLVCHICNKEFNDPYLFNTHRLQEHGFSEMVDLNHMETGELPDREEIMRSMNQSLSRMASDASAVNYASGFGGSKAGKSQETVVCDICNKEIANQYFLRLHKFNAHGIDPMTNDKYEGRPLSSPISMTSHPRTPPSSNTMTMSPPSQQSLNMASFNPGKHPMLPFMPPKIDFKDMPPFADFGRDFKSLRDMPPFMADSINNELFARSQNRRHLDLNIFGFPSLGKLPGEDNVKLNFDPEAYCDICKKEFCSKYFLRTHKQNIHGIKCDLPSSSITKTNDLDRLTNSLPMRTSTYTSNGRAKENAEKSTWRWKEPVNSSRVICDICNKEVCNKYFLRTHKFKKHGIPPSSQSPNMSMNGSPNASDCDSASNASSQPDEKPIRLDSMINMPQMIPLPPSEKLSEKFPQKNMNNLKSRDLHQSHIPLNNNNNNINEYIETCGVCNRRFKNARLLKEHILKHHSLNDTMDPRAKSSPPIYPCQVCGIDFPAELSVQLHLIQEHNARVTLDTEDSHIPTEEPSLPNGEEIHGSPKLYSRQLRIRKKTYHQTRTKKYVCSHCDFTSTWLSSLIDHEQDSHGLSMSSTTLSYRCKECHKLESSLHGLSSHLKEDHGWTNQDVLSEVQSHRPSSSNTFKCSHCPALFSSHVKAVAHFRQVHIRARRDASLKKSSYQQNLLHCPSCPFRTHFVLKFRHHIKRHHLSNSSKDVYKRSKEAAITSIPEVSSPLNSLRLSTSLPASIEKSASRKEEINQGLNRNNMTPGGVGGYKGIAASLLSSNCPDDRRERRCATPNEKQSRDDIILQTYTLPLSPVVVDTPSFKMAAQNSGQHAVIGL